MTAPTSPTGAAARGHLDSLEHLLARTAAWATAATLELDDAALEVRHQAEHVLQEAQATVEPAIRRSRQAEGTRAVELAREIERLVAIQRRLGILATDALARAPRVGTVIGLHLAGAAFARSSSYHSSRDVPTGIDYRRL